MSNVCISDDCTQCGSCDDVCPVEAIQVGEDGKRRVNDNLCLDCGGCIDECPVLAIRPDCTRNDNCTNCHANGYIM